ncbi:MAG TPA: HDOD domain-containing protein [Burkholderiaceae bacterium]
MADLSAFFNDVKLPVISEVAHALIRTLDDEDTSAKAVSALIAKDPALTAKLMRLANSARFGSARGVNSLDDAISMAGMAHVRTLALAACFAESFPAMPGLDSDEFWKSSMACAGYAKWLASCIGIDGQDAWLAGMMLRLGELLIYQAAPASFAEIEMQPHLPGGRWEREQRLLGFSEGQITAELGRRWNFPVTIVEAIEHSNDPMAAHPFNQLSGIIHLASLLADTPSDDKEILDTLPEDVVHALQLDIEWMKPRLPAHSSFSAAP